MRRTTGSGRLVLAITAAIMGMGVASASAAPADQPSVVTGTIVAVNGNTVTIASADGTQKIVKTQPDTLILSREVAVLGTIKAGDALAVTAKRGGNGSLTAISINIFSPELWSRVRKGQWTMESGDIMTNALVEQTVERVEGRTLHMKVDQGTATISVPAATEIHRLRTMHLADLKPGIRITARGVGDADGTIKASSIIFDRPG